MAARLHGSYASSMQDPGSPMPHSLDFASLRQAYAEGAASPISVACKVAARIRERGEDAVWISRVPEDALLESAAAIERRAAAEGIAAMPLYGFPFAVKDNIDAAGLPTTAACPDCTYLPTRSALAVERLLAAGALLIGKTNLDQFATGLVGTRSPYGAPLNPFDPAFIPGGSSSGSAVAVAAGLVAFALGTDTAGSGRVPAAFNNIVGLKPTRGLVSARGVVPACRSLDCVSVFALTVSDAAAVLEVIRGADPEDGYSRRAPPGFACFGTMPMRFTFGVPSREQREFFGNADAGALFETAITRLTGLGGTAAEVDLAPFLEAGSLLYRGAWLAERMAAIDEATGGKRESLHPVTRQIIAGGQSISGTAVFRDRYRLAELRQKAERVWDEIDLLLLPTTGTIYRIAEIEADPFGLNERLGRYANFTNLLDLSAIAVPNGLQSEGLPAGVTLLAPAFHDPLLAAVAAAFHAQTGLTLGATDAPLPPLKLPPAAAVFPYVPIAVVGAHLSGQPLNGELVLLGARLRRATRTAPEYRLYALPDGKRPGLLHRPGEGAAIEVEIWDVPTALIGVLLNAIAPPLGLGTLTLEDGSRVAGLLCESYAVEGARDITAFGGWRAWRASLLDPD
jgi:allophanate hydrolase